MSIPTLLVFKDGEVVDKVVGFQPKEALSELIRKTRLSNQRTLADILAEVFSFLA